uniref:Uncharacterized protein n=1 Tax=Arundo donax TaxID=35708 RepID=A0A0A8YK96_ARUDO
MLAGGGVRRHLRGTRILLKMEITPAAEGQFLDAIPPLSYGIIVGCT